MERVLHPAQEPGNRARQQTSANLLHLFVREPLLDVPLGVRFGYDVDRLLLVLERLDDLVQKTLRSDLKGPITSSPAGQTERQYAAL